MVTLGAAAVFSSWLLVLSAMVSSKPFELVVMVGLDAGLIIVMHFRPLLLEIITSMLLQGQTVQYGYFSRPNAPKY